MANRNITINPQDLIPEYWHGIYVTTEADLIFIGSKNLEYLKQYWRSEERSLSRQVKAAQADIDLLAGKTLEDIKTMAAQYENPDFPRISVMKDGWGDDPESLDAASTNYKPNVTTFKVCGGCDCCERCKTGTYQPEYYVITDCPFIPPHLIKEWCLGNKDVYRFNTPCALANGTQELLDTCVEYLKARKAKLVARKQRAGAYAGYLAQVMRKAEEKPCFASQRPYNWFNLDDQVMFFVCDSDGAIPSKLGTFVPGIVINGYRYHYNRVSVRSDEPFHTSEYCDGCGSYYGAARPEVLHVWEYEYLKSHPDYLKAWVHCAKADLYDFDSERFTEALTKA